MILWPFKMIHSITGEYLKKLHLTNANKINLLTFYLMTRFTGGRKIQAE